MPVIEFSRAVEEEKERLRKVHPTVEDIPSCAKTVDTFLSCHVFLTQMKSLYRFGQRSVCTDKFEDVKFCFSMRSMHPEEKREAWIQRRAEWWATRRISQSSEDVWDTRIEPLKNFPVPLSAQNLGSNDDRLTKANLLSNIFNVDKQPFLPNVFNTRRVHVPYVHTPNNPSLASTTPTMDTVSLLSLPAGILFRVIIDAVVGEPNPRLTATLTGIWEGILLHHNHASNPFSSPTVPYIAYTMRLTIDFLLTRDAMKILIVVLWTGVTAVIAELLSPAHWYDTISERDAHKHRKSRHSSHSHRGRTLERSHRRRAQKPHLEVPLREEIHESPGSTTPSPSPSLAIPVPTPVKQATAKSRIPLPRLITSFNNGTSYSPSLSSSSKRLKLNSTMSESPRRAVFAVKTPYVSPITEREEVSREERASWSSRYGHENVDLDSASPPESESSSPDALILIPSNFKS